MVGGLVRVPPMGRRVFLGAAAATVLACLDDCSAEPDYPAGPLRIASGGSGGVYHAYALGVDAVVRAALPRPRPTVLATAASVENLPMVAAGPRSVWGAGGGAGGPRRAGCGGVSPDRTPPATTYGLGAPTVTVGVANYLVVATSMDERVAYHVTRALFEHRDLLARAHPAGSRLDRGAAISTYPLPLHPGATRYYRAAKL